MTKRHDDMTRLLDGEMTGRERREFLQDLDHHHPEEWRNLALGFVEQQLISEALRARQNEQQAKVVPLKSSSSWNIASLSGIAAALILGLFLGTLQFGDRSDPEANLLGTSTPAQPSTSNPTLENIALAGRVAPLEELNIALKKQGYDPQMTRGYIEAEMADGRQLIVPISQLAMSEQE